MLPREQMTSARVMGTTFESYNRHEVLKMIILEIELEILTSMIYSTSYANRILGNF